MEKKNSRMVQNPSSFAAYLTLVSILQGAALAVCSAGCSPLTHSVNWFRENTLCMFVFKRDGCNKSDDLQAHRDGDWASPFANLFLVQPGTSKNHSFGMRFQSRDNAPS